MIYHSALLNNNPLLTLTVPLRGLLGGPICLERARSRSAPRPVSGLGPDTCCAYSRCSLFSLLFITSLENSPSKISSDLTDLRSSLSSILFTLRRPLLPWWRHWFYYYFDSLPPLPSRGAETWLCDGLCPRRTWLRHVRRTGRDVLVSVFLTKLHVSILWFTFLFFLFSYFTASSSSLLFYIDYIER